MSIGCGEPDDDAEDGAPLAATRCPAWRANTIERVCALHFYASYMSTNHARERECKVIVLEQRIS
jgi:hypothetical protein